MSNPKIAVICPECGKERLVTKFNTRRPAFTGLCCSCSMRVSHKEYYERKRNRPLSDRPIEKRSDGYHSVFLPPWHWCYPMASKARHSIMVHRLVMAEYLGRLLEPWEIVHHKNGVRDDNRIENLELTTLSKHHLKYEDGYAKGFRDGIAIRDRELEKQIKLLQWQVKQLIKSSQLRFEV